MEYETKTKKLRPKSESVIGSLRDESKIKKLRPESEFIGVLVAAVRFEPTTVRV